MLHRKGAKKDSYFMPYFWIYALFVLFSTSCNRIRPELMAQYNATLGELSAAAQDAYLELRNLLDDEGKVKLQKQIGQIKGVKDLEDFIYKRFENQRNLNLLLKYFPKGEQTKVKKQFAELVTLADQEGFLNECSKPFEKIQQVDPPTKQHYIDLIALLRDDQTIKFKNEVIQSKDVQQVVELIALKSCNVFGKLNKEDKESLSKLKDGDRQDILRKVMQSNDTKDSSGMHTGKEESSQAKPHNKPIAPNMPNDKHATIPKPDINKLIEQKCKAQQEQKKKNEAIPQDEWGDKLSLIEPEENRKNFLFLVMQFAEADQKTLKELFYKVVPDSLKKFFAVFFKGFEIKERTQLLATMIYLYQVNQPLTIKLCNAPKSVSIFEKFRLYNQTTTDQLRLLKKLDTLLSEEKKS